MEQNLKIAMENSSYRAKWEILHLEQEIKTRTQRKKGNICINGINISKIGKKKDDVIISTNQ